MFRLVYILAVILLCPSTLYAAKSSPPRDMEPLEYTVRSGDTLSEISIRFDVGLRFLKRLNNLKSDTIRPGQKLRLRPTSQEEAVHVIQAGDTLSFIALHYRVSVNDIRRINGIRGDRIYVGQKLRLREANSTVHIVERGDALWEIARAYGISVNQLKELNGLSSNRIYPRPGTQTQQYPNRPAGYLYCAGGRLPRADRTSAPDESC